MKYIFKLFLIIILIIILVIFIIYLSKKIVLDKLKNKNKKELRFIHITKNAGTFIEKTAKTHDIFFGMHDNEYVTDMKKYSNEFSPWHRVFPLLDNKIKSKYDWFMVVRNPYDRILSEAYCNWDGIKADSKENFNKLLISRIKKRSTVGNHFTEQYKYLDNSVKIHIIKFENLIPELKKLYVMYNLDIDLDNKNKINKSQRVKKYTVNDFNEELIQLINKIYHLDFVNFGYSKLK